MNASRWLRALALFCAAVFVLLALQVATHGPVIEMDLAVSRWFAQHRTPAMTAFMRAITAMHQTVWVLAATAAIALWRGLRRDLRSVGALLVVPVGMLLNVALKESFRRARPSLDDPLVELASFSFPSGHALASTVFYGMLCALVLTHVRARRLRILAAGAAVLMVLLVTTSRVYLGAHFPSDVMAGVAEGILCILAFLRFTRVREPL